MGKPERWTKEAMSAAVQEVKMGMSVRKAAKKYSVPKSTLSDRLVGKVQEGAIWGKKSVINKSDEIDLAECAKSRSEMGIGFSKSNFLKFVGIFGKHKGVGFKNGQPSEMWWRKFKVRNPGFSLRAAEATASVRHDAMSRPRIARYFSELKSVVEKHNLTSFPERIWNFDETGVSLNPKPVRVIAKTGQKTVHSKCSNSRETITVIGCGNAAGRVIPPHFIVPGMSRKKLEGYDTDQALEVGSPIKGATFSVSDSGWTKDGIARLWFQNTFLKNIGPARPQLLICDGHESHHKVEFIDIARENNIEVIELPSHTSNWTQPMDRSVFKSLKSNWSVEVDDFYKTTGIVVGHAQFCKIFSRAWQNSVTISNVQSGFSATGIHPFNPNAIPEDAYKPNEAVCSELITSDTNNEIQSAQPEDDTSLENVQNQTIASITLSLPITDEFQVFDLPLAIESISDDVLDSSGNLKQAVTNSDEAVVQSPGTSRCSVENECTPAQAVEVVESTLSSEKLTLYHAALMSNVDIPNDPMFSTWKMYKEKTSTGTSLQEPLREVSANSLANQIFPLPKPKPTASRKRKQMQQYFVLTSDEIFNEKKKAQEEKVKKAEEKEQKRQIREQKRLMKMIEKLKKSSSRNVTN